MTNLAYAALWLFCFAVPMENVVVIPGFGTISKLMGMVALLLAALATVINARVRPLQTFHILAVLFVILAGLGVFRSIDEPRAVSKFLTYVQLVLVLWMIWELAPNFQRQRGLLLAYVCGAYVSAISTFIDYREGLHISKAASRFATGAFDPNDLGMTLALGIPMAWYLAVTYRQPLLRWLCRGYVPMGVLAIGLTASRGAMIAMIVALLIIPAAMTRLSPVKMVGTILVLAVVGTVAVSYIPETTWKRWSTTKSEVETGTMNSRLNTWRVAVRVFTFKPILGYGTSGFNWAVKGQSHNSYLAILIEQGVVGFILYFGMFVAVLANVLRLPPLERRFALILVATLAIAMLPLGWDDRKPVWIILAVLSAMTAALNSPTLSPQALPRPVPRRPVPIARQPASS
ncbi:MAG TPA: O-antigen ligase family protein [Gemmatimonadales bacterium]|jgi:O-antigen ligase|nr:O-antigen ligase family protein [Gemmatimonadales bacterium]